MVFTFIDQKNDAKMTSGGNTNRRREVSMQSFEHFEVISVVDKRIHIVVVLFFTIVLRFLYVHFR